MSVNEGRFSAQDDVFMGEAIREALLGRGETSPRPSVGAVVVNQGRMVGRGRTQPVPGPHAEVLALQDAGEAARGGTLYVTLEPCTFVGHVPACTDAITAAGIARVVIGCIDPNPRMVTRAAEALEPHGTTVHVMESMTAEIESIMAEYLKWVTTGLPFVSVIMVVDLLGTSLMGCDMRFPGIENLMFNLGGLLPYCDLLLHSGIAAAQEGLLTLATRGSYRCCMSVRPSNKSVLFARQPSRWILEKQPDLVSRHPSAGHADRADGGSANWSEGLQSSVDSVELSTLLSEAGEHGITSVLAIGRDLTRELLYEDLTDRLATATYPTILGSPDSTGPGHIGRPTQASAWSDVRPEQLLYSGEGTVACYTL